MKSNTAGECDLGDNQVTLTIKNQGSADIPGFTTRLAIDSENDAAIDQSISGVAAGSSADLKFENVKMKKGEHSLSATADVRNVIAETREDNNTLAATVKCKSEDDE
jgi:subtilase family serine protease